MKITLEQAKQLGTDIGINWRTARFSVEEFRRGIQEEGTEHNDVIKGDTKMAAKITVPHLNKMPDHYEKLHLMEKGK